MSLREYIHDTLAQKQSLSFNPLDPKSYIEPFGLFGVYAVLFAETGLLIGFFLPGDTLLFVAGVGTTSVAVKVAGAQLSLPLLLIGCPLFATAGAQVGHFLGAKFGRAMFEKPNSVIFQKKYVDKAEGVFNKYGPGKSVVLARFIPLVRTFLNPVAGVLEMSARRFFVYNLIGAVLWTDSIILLGHFLGERFGNFPIDKFVLPVIGGVVLLSLIPVTIELVKNKREQRRAAATASTHEPRHADRSA
ncbi:DedA family protein [Fodinicola feengrottensis]|uniref:DedA family protein n=1 Tax=Fodinicola feengrottensis TaxID=435914 RepID=A0ABN2H0G7_9ACTN|nr:VTT domain-containing protein [Fodinicola feengrottensis]